MGAVIEKTSCVLNLVARREPISLAELTRLTGYRKPALYLMLKSLVQVGFLEKSESGQYSIGRSLYRLIEKRKSFSRLTVASRRCARHLSGYLHESVTVAVIEDAEYRWLYHENCTLPVRLDRNLTQGRSLYGSATGRILLASLSPDRVAQVIERYGMPSSEEWPECSTPELLMKQLAGLRDCSVVQVRRDELQAVYIAVSVFSRLTDSMLAVGVDVPLYRASGDYLNTIVGSLKKEAHSLWNILSR